MERDLCMDPGHHLIVSLSAGKSPFGFRRITFTMLFFLREMGGAVHMACRTFPSVSMQWWRSIIYWSAIGTIPKLIWIIIQRNSEALTLAMCGCFMKSQQAHSVWDLEHSFTSHYNNSSICIICLDCTSTAHVQWCKYVHNICLHTPQTLCKTKNTCVCTSPAAIWSTTP